MNQQPKITAMNALDDLKCLIMKCSDDFKAGRISATQALTKDRMIGRSVAALQRSVRLNEQERTCLQTLMMIRRMNRLEIMATRAVQRAA